MARAPDIVDAFCRVRDRQSMVRFLVEILTEAERHDLALRWELMRRLHAGVAQREVAAELGISLCKITRGSRVLKRTDSVCRRLLEAGESEDSVEQN